MPRRFVPDEQDFSGREVRDAAASLPADYEPPVYETKALQHTNVQLTWDQDDPSRRKVLHKKVGFICLCVFHSAPKKITLYIHTKKSVRQFVFVCVANRHGGPLLCAYATADKYP